MLGMIGGTGFSELSNIEVIDRRWIETPFGEASGPVTVARYNDIEYVFLARHGVPHKIPPHLINYRANLFALKSCGANKVIAINAVGGIHAKLGPGKIAIPDQIIDYTYGRDHSIYDSDYIETVDHIDFTYPYNSTLRGSLIEASRSLSIEVLDNGVYGATQGPRLESAAEILRCKRDGCDMVGMTGMPEASLAREFGLDYACIAMSANWAAGLSDQPITMSDIKASISNASERVNRILFKALSNL